MCDCRQTLLAMSMLLYACGSVSPGDDVDAGESDPDASTGDAQPTQDGPDPCMPRILLSGAMLPEAEGWQRSDNLLDAPDVISDDNVLRVNTMNEPANSGPMLLYSFDASLIPGPDYVVEWSMRVIQADPHNAFDAGVAFLGSYSGGFGGPDERGQMVYFDSTMIGWADDSQTFAIDTVSAPHVYRLTVDGAGNATVTVDGNIALARSGFSTNGVIAFGDQSNDSNVDGTFEIDYVSIPCTD